MAIYLFSFRHGSRARGYSAWGHAKYILREEQYSQYNRHELGFGQSGNLPTWATDARHFWQAVDEHEFVHARLYSEFVVALPRELTTEQQIELTLGFIEKELGDRYPYTIGIHHRAVAFGEGSNPHAHIMFSCRRNDGVERDEHQYFKIHHHGGAKKDREFMPKARLQDLRQSWEHSLNHALEQAGHDARVSHRSLADRGIGLRPCPKLSPYETMLYRQGVTLGRAAEIEVIRDARAILETAPKQQQQLNATLKELQADLAQYEALDRLKATNALKRSLEQTQQELQRVLTQSQQLTEEQKKLEALMQTQAQAGSTDVFSYLYQGQFIAFERALQTCPDRRERQQIRQQLKAFQRSLDTPAEQARQEQVAQRLAETQHAYQQAIDRLSQIAEERQMLQERLQPLQQQEQEMLSILHRHNSISQMHQVAVGQTEREEQPQQEHEQAQSNLSLTPFELGLGVGRTGG